MLTTLYADRLAPEGILVHEIRPGVIDTDMTGTVHEKYDKLMYTTGNYIDVDGGFHIRRL